jgi:hypothetical protein
LGISFLLGLQPMATRKKEGMTTCEGEEERRKKKEE